MKPKSLVLPLLLMRLFSTSGRFRMGRAETDFSQGFHPEDDLRRQGMGVFKGRFFLDPISSLFPKFSQGSKMPWMDPLAAHTLRPVSNPFKRGVESPASHADSYFGEEGADFDTKFVNNGSNYSPEETTEIADLRESLSTSTDASQELSEVLTGAKFEATSLHDTDEAKDFADAFQLAGEDSADAVDETASFPAYFESPFVEKQPPSSFSEELVGEAGDLVEKNGVDNADSNLNSTTKLHGNIGAHERVDDRAPRQKTFSSSPTNLLPLRENVTTFSRRRQRMENAGHITTSGNVSSIRSSSGKVPEVAAARVQPAARHSVDPEAQAPRPSTPIEAQGTSRVKRAGTSREKMKTPTSEPSLRTAYAASRTRTSGATPVSQSPAATSDWSLPHLSSIPEVIFPFSDEVDPLTSHTPPQNVSTSPTLTFPSSARTASSPPSQKRTKRLLASTKTQGSSSMTPVEATTRELPSSSGASVKMSSSSSLPTSFSSTYFSFPSPRSPAFPLSNASDDVEPQWVSYAGDLLTASPATPPATSPFAPSHASAAHQQLPFFPPPAAVASPETTPTQKTPNVEQKPRPPSPHQMQRRSSDRLSSIPSHPQDRDADSALSPPLASPQNVPGNTVFSQQRRLLHTSPPYTPPPHVADHSHATTAFVADGVQVEDAFPATGVHEAEKHNSPAPTLENNVRQGSSHTDSASHRTRSEAGDENDSQGFQPLLSEHGMSRTPSLHTAFQFPSSPPSISSSAKFSHLSPDPFSRSSSLSAPPSSSPPRSPPPSSVPPSAPPQSPPLPPLSSESRPLAPSPRLTGVNETFPKYLVPEGNILSAGANSPQEEEASSSFFTFDTANPLPPVPSASDPSPLPAVASSGFSRSFSWTGGLPTVSHHSSPRSAPLGRTFSSSAVSDLNSSPSSPAISFPSPRSSAHSAEGSLDEGNPSVVENLTDRSDFVMSRHPSTVDLLKSLLSPSSPASSYPRGSPISLSPSPRTYVAQPTPTHSSLSSGNSSSNDSGTETAAAVLTSPRPPSPVDPQLIPNSEDIGTRITNMLLDILEHSTAGSDSVMSTHPSATEHLKSLFSPSSPASPYPQGSPISLPPSPRTYTPHRGLISSPQSGGNSSNTNGGMETAAAAATSPQPPFPVDPSLVPSAEDIGTRIANAILNNLYRDAQEQAAGKVSTADVANQAQQAGQIRPQAEVGDTVAAEGGSPRDSGLEKGAQHRLLLHAGGPSLEHVDTCLELDAELVGGELLSAFPEVADLALCIALCNDAQDNYCTHFSYYSKRKICLLRSAGADLQFLSESNSETHRDQDSSIPPHPLEVGNSAHVRATTTHVTAALNKTGQKVTNGPRQRPIFDDVPPLEFRPAAGILSGKLRGAEERCVWKHSILVEQKPNGMRQTPQERLLHKDSPHHQRKQGRSDTGFDQVDEENDAAQLPFQTLSAEAGVGGDASAFDEELDEGDIAQEGDETNLEEETAYEEEEFDEGHEEGAEGEGGEGEGGEEGEDGEEEEEEEGLDATIEDNLSTLDDAAGIDQNETGSSDAGYPKILKVKGKSQSLELDEDRQGRISSNSVLPIFPERVYLAADETVHSKKADSELRGRRLLQRQGTPQTGDTPTGAEGKPSLRQQWHAAAATAMAAAAERALLELELELRQQQKQQKEQPRATPALPGDVGDGFGDKISQQDLATTVAAAAVAVAVEQGLLAMKQEQQQRLLVQQEDIAPALQQQRQYQQLGTVSGKNAQTSTAETRKTAIDELSCSLNLALGEVVSPECRAKFNEVPPERKTTFSPSPSSSSAYRPLSPGFASPRLTPTLSFPASAATSSPLASGSPAASASLREQEPSPLYSPSYSSSSSNVRPSSDTSSELPSHFSHTSLGSSSPFLSPITPPRTLPDSSAFSFPASAQPRRLGDEAAKEDGRPDVRRDRHRTATQKSVAAAAADAIADALRTAEQKAPSSARSDRPAAQFTNQRAQTVETGLTSQKRRKLEEKRGLSAEPTRQHSSVSLPATRTRSGRKKETGGQKSRSSKNITRSRIGSSNGARVNEANTAAPCSKGDDCGKGAKARDTRDTRRRRGLGSALSRANGKPPHVFAEPENLQKPHASVFPPDWFLPVSIAPSPSCPLEWQLTKEFVGWDVFDEKNFWFFSFDDPTHGFVNYLTREEALRNKLISVTPDGRSIIRADAWNKVPYGARGRDSVRLTSTRGYDDVIWVVSVNHVPAGCSMWPALWTLGPPPWPDSGEVDIFEGVNLARYNHVSLHTGKGCSMWNIPETAFSGVWAHAGGGREARDCWAYATPTNSGCAIEAVEETFGEPLNAKGGGVFVMEMKRDSHVRVWFFHHHEVPRDLVEGHPVPDLWSFETKLPQAAFPLGPNCPGRENFSLQRLVINLTFCGDWAGTAFSNEQGCPGVGTEACQRFVQDNPEAFKSAYWDINFIQVYTPTQGACGRRMHERSSGAGAHPLVGRLHDNSNFSSFPYSPGSTIIRNPGFVPSAPQFLWSAAPPSVAEADPSQPLHQQPEHQQLRFPQPPSYDTEATGFLPSLHSTYQQLQQFPYVAYRHRHQQYEQQHRQEQQQRQHQKQLQQYEHQLQQLQQQHQQQQQQQYQQQQQQYQQQQQQYQQQQQQYQQQQQQYQQQQHYTSEGGSDVHPSRPILQQQIQFTQAGTPEYPPYSWHSAPQQEPRQQLFHVPQAPTAHQQQQVFPPLSSYTQSDPHFRDPSFAQQQQPPVLKPGLYTAVAGPNAAPGTQSTQQRDWWATLFDVVAQLSGQPTGRCNEKDVVYYGFDLKAYKGYVPFTWQCRVLCASSAACFFFTHFPDEATCFLKSIEALKGRVANQPGFISGQKVCRSVEEEDPIDIV